VVVTATREDIARQFNELAGRFGFRRTAVEDVARALHISKKTIYQHFASKEELLRYAVELGSQEQCRRVEDMLTESTALGRLQQVATIALADARAYFAGSPAAEIAEPADLVATVNTVVFGRLLRELVAEGMAAGEFEIADPDTAVAFLNAIGMEAVRLIHSDQSRHPEAGLLEAMRRLLGCGVTAGGAAALPV
jgi:AcrR family transcriptional regulator